VVFEQPEVTILSCHVEGQRMKEPQSQLLVEIKSASDSSKTETVFELPVSNFFQVKNLPKTKHLLQLRTSLQSRTHRFEPIETKKIACLNCSLAACEPILEMMSCLVFTKLLICVSKWI
jgi:hypothetical protein